MAEGTNKAPVIASYAPDEAIEAETNCLSEAERPFTNFVGGAPDNAVAGG